MSTLAVQYISDLLVLRARPTLEQLFRAPPYNSNPPFRQMPGNLTYTELHLWASPEEPSQRFAWLTEPVVVYGDLQFGMSNAAQGAPDVLQSQDRLRSVCLFLLNLRCMQRTSLLFDRYPAIPNDHGGRTARVPCSIGVTRYHFLLLYNDYFQVLAFDRYPLCISG